MANSIPYKLNAIEALLKRTYKEVERLKRIGESDRSLLPRFVESSPAQRTFGDLLDEILNVRLMARLDVDIEVCMSGYFDQARVDRLMGIAGRPRGKVRIISPELKASKEDKINLDALRRMEKEGAKVKIHPMLHARIFYVRMGDHCQVIIGSGDIKSDCLGGRRFDAGIWSNRPDVVKATIDFFDRVWEDDGAKNLSEI